MLTMIGRGFYIMTADSQREILTVDQTAELLQVSNMMIYRLIRTGSLKAARFGKFWRISRQELLRTCANPKKKGR